MDNDEGIKQWGLFLPGEGITSPLRPEAGVDEAGLRPGGGARDHHDGSGDEDGHDDHGDEDGHGNHGDDNDERVNGGEERNWVLNLAQRPTVSWESCNMSTLNRNKIIADKNSYDKLSVKSRRISTICEW